MLLIMAGATLSAIGAYHGSVIIPQGIDVSIGDSLQPSGILSIPSAVMDLQLRVNKFTIEYRPTGEVCIVDNQSFGFVIEVTTTSEGGSDVLHGILCNRSYSFGRISP